MGDVFGVAERKDEEGGVADDAVGITDVGVEDTDTLGRMAHFMTRLPPARRTVLIAGHHYDLLTVAEANTRVITVTDADAPRAASDIVAVALGRKTAGSAYSAAKPFAIETQGKTSLPKLALPACRTRSGKLVYPKGYESPDERVRGNNQVLWCVFPFDRMGMVVENLLPPRVAELDYSLHTGVRLRLDGRLANISRKSKIMTQGTRNTGECIASMWSITAACATEHEELALFARPYGMTLKTHATSSHMLHFVDTTVFENNLHWNHHASVFPGARYTIPARSGTGNFVVMVFQTGHVNVTGCSNVGDAQWTMRQARTHIEPACVAINMGHLIHLEETGGGLL